MVASPWNINTNTQQFNFLVRTIQWANHLSERNIVKHRAYVSPTTFVDKNAGFDAFSPALLFAKQ